MILEEQGLIRCDWEPPLRNLPLPILSARINDNTRVTYDTMDGPLWVGGGIRDNLEYFNAEGPEGWYFMRSFLPALKNEAPEGCYVAPLGLNYYITPSYPYGIRRPLGYLRSVARHSMLARRMGASRPILREDIESPPTRAAGDKVLLYTRLWDPEATSRGGTAADDRRAINAKRVEVVQVVRRELGERATVGIQADAFSSRFAPKSLLLPAKNSDKHSYLQKMKQHSICIATTGLHGSTGWRFAEYVAASRAVISEPLVYEAGPGMTRGMNYLEFTNAESLLTAIDGLLRDATSMEEMMAQNHEYYLQRLRPDELVWRTLMVALGEMSPED